MLFIVGAPGRLLRRAHCTWLRCAVSSFSRTTHRRPKVALPCWAGPGHLTRVLSMCSCVFPVSTVWGGLSPQLVGGPLQRQLCPE